jgi:hypothetical protein
VLRTLFCCLILPVCLTGFIGCSSTGTTKAENPAAIYIQRLDPRDPESNLVIPDASRYVQMTVDFKALQITPGEAYYAVVASKSGEVLDSRELVWQAGDLNPAAGGNATQGLQTIDSRTKTAVFNISCEREDISRMREDYNEAYLQLLQTVTFKQELAPPANEALCEKYVSISLLTAAEFQLPKTTLASIGAVSGI